MSAVKPSQKGSCDGVVLCIGEAVIIGRPASLFRNCGYCNSIRTLLYLVTARWPVLLFLVPGTKEIFGKKPVAMEDYAHDNIGITMTVSGNGSMRAI